MNSLAEAPQPKAELVDLIAHDIREGVYHPRERLIEVELCARYRTSRNAVRGALIELAALGLVEREANRGARVRPVSIDEAIESTEVRLSLQAMCAGRAATRVTDADRAELDRAAGRAALVGRGRRPLAHRRGELGDLAGHPPHQRSPDRLAHHRDAAEPGAHQLVPVPAAGPAGGLDARVRAGRRRP